MAYAHTHRHTHKHKCIYTSSLGSLSWCVGWNATLIRDNGQTWQGRQCCHTEREGGKRDDKARDRKRETKKNRGREERNREGVKKEGRNSQFISRQNRQKRGNERGHMPAHVSSETPLPHLVPLHKLEASPSASPSPSASSSSSSSSSHQGVDVEGSGAKQMCFTNVVPSPLLANYSCSPAQPDWWHYKWTHTSKCVSVTWGSHTDSFSLSCVAQFLIFSKTYVKGLDPCM